MTILLGGVLICSFEGCNEDSMYLFFSFFLDTLFLYLRSYDHLLTYIVLILLYIWMYVFLSPTPYMCCFFSLFMVMLLNTCMQSICLKCFRNTSCQSLLAINSLLAKIFKSLC